MNLTWYARRLGRMSPAEIKGRLGDTWIKGRWRRRQVRQGEVRSVGAASGDSGIRKRDRSR